MNKHVIALALTSGIATGLLYTSQTLAQTKHIKPYSAQVADSKRLPKIIGGKETQESRYPFMTALIGRNSSSINPFCGASFIGGRYVLTASHCLEGELAENLAVWIGGHDVRNPEGGRRVNVAQIYLHEEYDSFSVNKDIAIVELVEEVTGVTPINLITPEIEATLENGHVFTVMGWGNRDTSSETGDFPDILHEVEVPLYDRATCEQNYTPEGETETGITEYMMCAGLAEGGKDSCQGDSGGPLVFQRDGEWYQAGVVSFGDGCAVANKPGVYARVAKFNDWVAQKRAGVSYRQTLRNGFVENIFDEDITFGFKNVGQTDYRITSVAVVNADSQLTANVANNGCDAVTLSFDDTCDINVNVKSASTGNGGFTLRVGTNHPGNGEVDLTYSMHSLAPETLDMPELTGSSEAITWYGGSDANWQAQTAQTDSGTNAIASGDITDNQSSVLLATVEGSQASQMGLKYLVSSEENYDHLIVRLNNRIVLRESGTNETAFQDLSINLGEGRNRIAIAYVKDSSESDGDDKAYVDSVSLTLTNRAPVAVASASGTSVEEATTFTLNASESSDADEQTLTYQWEQLDATDANRATIANATDASTQVTAPEVEADTELRFRVTVTDTAGATSEATVTVMVTNQAATTPPTTPTTPTTPRSSSGSSGGGSMGWLTVLMLTGLMGWKRRTRSRQS